jgi:hypothetical protein
MPMGVPIGRRLTGRGLGAQDAHRALQEADEYLAAGDILAGC